MEKLKTPNQIKWDKIRAKVISQFNELSDVEGSNWQKANLIAKKQSVTPHYVMRVINAHNEATTNTNEQSS